MASERKLRTRAAIVPLRRVQLRGDTSASAHDAHRIYKHSCPYSSTELGGEGTPSRQIPTEGTLQACNDQVEAACVSSKFGVAIQDPADDRAAAKGASSAPPQVPRANTPSEFGPDLHAISSPREAIGDHSTSLTGCDEMIFQFPDGSCADAETVLSALRLASVTGQVTDNFGAASEPFLHSTDQNHLRQSSNPPSSELRHMATQCEFDTGTEQLQHVQEKLQQTENELANADSTVKEKVLACNDLDAKMCSLLEDLSAARTSEAEWQEAYHKTERLTFQTNEALVAAKKASQKAEETLTIEQSDANLRNSVLQDELNRVRTELSARVERHEAHEMTFELHMQSAVADMEVHQQQRDDALVKLSATQEHADTSSRHHTESQQNAEAKTFNLEEDVVRLGFVARNAQFLVSQLKEEADEASARASITRAENRILQDANHELKVTLQETSSQMAIHEENSEWDRVRRDDAEDALTETSARQSTLLDELLAARSLVQELSEQVSACSKERVQDLKMYAAELQKSRAQSDHIWNEMNLCRFRHTASEQALKVDVEGWYHAGLNVAGTMQDMPLHAMAHALRLDPSIEQQCPTIPATRCVHGQQEKQPPQSMTSESNIDYQPGSDFDTIGLQYNARLQHRLQEKLLPPPRRQEFYTANASDCIKSPDEKGVYHITAERASSNSQSHESRKADNCNEEDIFADIGTQALW